MTKKILGTLLVTLSLAFAVQTHAQTVLPLTVGPARQQITINPGEDTQLSVKFYNQSDSPISGLVKVADFIVSDDQGTPRIIENAEQASPKFSASQWIELPFDRMTIAANDKAVVQFNLKVPADAKAGGRYAAIYFEPVSPFAQPVGESGASITPRIASLLYIRVSGPITENAFISGLFAKSFQEFGPVIVTGQINNAGDFHIRPRGVFTLSDSFGSLVEQTNLKESNIFPDAARTFTATLGQKWMFGKFKVNLTASYGEKGQALNNSLYVWVMPWRVMIIVVLALIILFLLGKALYKNTISREATLEEELSQEREEIEKLKNQLKKRKD